MQVAEQNRKSRVIGRLLRMGLPEIACRSRQEALKWAERMQSTTDISVARGKRKSVDRDGIARFVQNAAENLLPGPLDDRLTAALALGAPEHCKQILAAADKLCRAKFDLLGYKNLDFGNPPDWHLDPVSGNRAPAAHWTRNAPA